MTILTREKDSAFVSIFLYDGLVSLTFAEWFNLRLRFGIECEKVFSIDDEPLNTYTLYSVPRGHETDVIAAIEALVD